MSRIFIVTNWKQRHAGGRSVGRQSRKVSSTREDFSHAFDGKLAFD
ncbi:MAG TPA: hypothetical protein VF666_16240 [Pyrinomonadaceae bacterium]